MPPLFPPSLQGLKETKAVGTEAKAPTQTPEASQGTTTMEGQGKGS